MCLFCFFGKRKRKENYAESKAFRLDDLLVFRSVASTVSIVHMIVIFMSKEAKTCNTIFSRQKKKKKKRTKYKMYKYF